MARPKELVVINDFSSGEVDTDVKRGADSVTTTGGRQMSNWRVLNSRKKTNRPGRSALFFENGRVEEILMSPGNKFFLVFGNGYLSVYNAAGTRVFNSTKKGDGTTAIPWTTATVGAISFAVAPVPSKSIYICYGDDAPSNVPQILTWDGVSQTSAWTLTTFAFETIYGFQYRAPFYRLSPQGISIWPSANSGSVTLVSSAPLFNVGMVNTRVRFGGLNSLVITNFTDSQHVTATIDFQLVQLAQMSWSGPGFTAPGGFQPGQEIIGSVSGYKGVIVAIDGTHIYAVGLTPTLMLGADVLVGPTCSSQGTLTATAVAYNSVTTNGTVVWDDELCNNYRGWPRAVFFDQGRLGFNNIPALPSAIMWSAIGNFADFYPDASSADNAIVELAPGKSQVLYIVPGMESSEFVFCDNAVYYIPISQTQPLEPGSVAFISLSEEGCYPVQPKAAEQTLLYVKAGGMQIGAVQAPGAYYRPYVIDVVAEFHSHLFTASPPVAIAVPAASAQFQELYAYILRADGVILTGRYAIRQGLLDVGQEGKPKIGWLPWTGAGAVSWISSLSADVIFTTVYAPNTGVVEKLDLTQYLDAAMFVNNLPTPLQPTPGKGPLLWQANQSVYLIDLGTRFMGTYQVDANGWIIPQNQGGENLASAQLIAGQPWTAVFEPFIPDAGAGQDQKQRTVRRKIIRAAVSVESSSGFVYATTRVPAYFVGDNAAIAAPLREYLYRFRFPGSQFDPRVVLQKDTPGPLIVVEYAIEVTA